VSISCSPSSLWTQVSQLVELLLLQRREARKRGHL
jgi:hypothetical protein